MNIAPIFGYLGGFWLLLVILTPIMAIFARRRARAAIIVRHLSLIVRQNLPLTPALHAAAASESGETRRILLRIARRVAMGIPLSRALPGAFRAAPALAVSVIDAAEQSGTLPAALAELNERLARQPEPTASDAARRWVLYSAILGVFTITYVVIVLGMLPKFITMLGQVQADTGGGPFVMQDIMEAGNPLGPAPVTTLGWVFRLLVIGLMVITPLCIVCGLARLRPRRADHISTLSILRDFAEWHLWPMRKLAWASCCARALPTMRLTLAAGWPLAQAVERASEIDANCFGRGHLRQWAERLRAGEDAIASGRALRLPEMLLAHVAVGMRDGDLEAPLYHAEGYYRAMENRWKLFLIQLLWPLTTLYMGAITGILTAGLIFMMKGFIDQACAAIG